MYHYEQTMSLNQETGNIIKEAFRELMSKDK